MQSSMTASGGGGLASTIVHAALAIVTGQATAVVAFRSRNRSKRDAYGRDSIGEKALLARRLVDAAGASG